MSIEMSYNSNIGKLELTVPEIEIPDEIIKEYKITYDTKVESRAEFGDHLIPYVGVPIGIGVDGYVRKRYLRLYVQEKINGDWSDKQPILGFINYQSDIRYNMTFPNRQDIKIKKMEIIVKVKTQLNYSNESQELRRTAISDITFSNIELINMGNNIVANRFNYTIMDLVQVINNVTGLRLELSENLNVEGITVNDEEFRIHKITLENDVFKLNLHSPADTFTRNTTRTTNNSATFEEINQIKPNTSDPYANPLRPAELKRDLFIIKNVNVMNDLGYNNINEFREAILEYFTRYKIVLGYMTYVNVDRNRNSWVKGLGQNITIAYRYNDIEYSIDQDNNLKFTFTLPQRQQSPNDVPEDYEILLVNNVNDMWSPSGVIPIRNTVDGTWIESTGGPMYDSRLSDNEPVTRNFIHELKFKYFNELLTSDTEVDSTLYHQFVTYGRYDSYSTVTDLKIPDISSYRIYPDVEPPRFMLEE